MAGVALATGTKLLYSADICVADIGASCHITTSDRGAVLTKDASTRMRNLKVSLDASGNKMRTWKLIDITGSVINPNTKQKMNIKMINCKFEGSKFNLCSLTKMTYSG